MQVSISYFITRKVKSMIPPKGVSLSPDEFNSKLVSLLLEMYAEQKITNEYLVGVAMDVRYPEMSTEERDAKYVEVMDKLDEHKLTAKMDFYETLFLEQTSENSENQEQ